MVLIPIMRHNIILLLRDSHLLVLILICSHLFGCVHGLYEDQVGKFDWRQQFVGDLNHLIDPLKRSSSSSWQSFDNIILSTKSNVLTSLYIRNGSIEWRHVLESNIDALASSANNNECSLMTINGFGNWIRCWSRDGLLLSESSLPRDVIEAIHNNKNYHVVYDLHVGTRKEVTLAKFDVVNANVDIVKFDVDTRVLKVTSEPIPTSWFRASASCEFITGQYLVCVNDEDLVLQFLPVGESKSFAGIPLSSFGLQATTKPKYLKIQKLPYQQYSNDPYFAVDLGGDGFILLQIREKQVTFVKVFPKVSAITVSPILDSNTNAFAVWILVIKENPIASDEAKSTPTTGIKLAAFNIENWSEIESVSSQFIINHEVFVNKINFIPLIRGENKYYYKLLISTEDATLIMTNLQGKVSWRREEALASIVSAEIIDLPLSELDAKLEQAFSFDQKNLLTQFLSRITSQLYQLQTFTSNLITQFTASLTMKPTRRKAPENDDEFNEAGDSAVKEVTDITSNLVRDQFGLHKVIVTLSSNGKLFGIDSLTGQIIWSLYETNLKIESAIKIPIWVQRTTAHYPYPSQCSVVNKNGFILAFNPITGEVIERVKLNVGVSQAMILSHNDNSYLKPILILDDKKRPVIYPSSAKSLFLKHKGVYFMLSAEDKNASLRGFSFDESDENELKAKEVWSIDLPTPINDLQVVFKRFNERVHSQGRVMGDRNVLYKYLNPNLVVIIGEAVDSQDKPFINFYLIDAITGAIIFTSVHKRAKGPIHVVHSENWIIYSYYNEKSRRTEISSVELYEGTTQSNSSAFSSLSRIDLMPAIVEQQTYIFPTGIEVMEDTITERGITNKHILIALPSGGLLELPKAFLDPRRPINPTPEHREEGLIPYIPELPIPSEGIINYNQSLSSIRGIQTAATNLESTCLVFAYGLDLFYTRVTPSKTFDILKDDFDHLLISAVLIGLIAFSYVTKWLSARKSLNASWK